MIFSYWLLFDVFRPAEIDDAWTASYVWNLTHNHSTLDTVFGAPSNIRYFGHIHAYLAGFFADIFGWTKAFFHFFNLLCMSGAFLAWVLTARTMLKNTRLALLCISLCFLLEPFVGGAYKGRPDAMVFFLVSAGVCAAAHRHFFCASFLCSVAVEIHPVSAIGYFQIAAFVICNGLKKTSRKKMPLWIATCVAGCLAGFSVYRFIHPEPLGEIFAYLMRSNIANDSFNALTAHYFNRAYFRFIPELLFILTGTVLYFYNIKKFTMDDPVLWLFISTVLASIIIRRSNFHYVIFFYPPFILFSMIGYSKSKFFYSAALGIIIYAAVLSMALYWQNRHVNHAAFDKNMAAVPLPEKTQAIVGPTNAWFTLKDRPFYKSFGAMRKGEAAPPTRIYYIQSSYTDALPACARHIRPVGQAFIFNNHPVQTFETDLSSCENK
jgi:hypothetical protein